MNLTLLTLALLPGADPAADDFFERSVRPVLADHCLKCHNASKQKGGVRLDGRDHLLKEQDGGAAVIKPGDSKTSRLMAAVRHEGDAPMPPGGKLAPEQMAALAKWIDLGAPWPAAAPKPAAVGKPHWAFQPVQSPPVPAGPDPEPIDRFVAAKLGDTGLTRGPPADRRVWLRRVAMDLVGLPPTAAEQAAFLADDSPDAAAKVVDRLLSSPGFGERWGRHWLDVARYADTREAGFQVDVRYPFAWTYRDWVIGAFNRDLPYPDFVADQLAADRRGRPAADPSLAALGFLTVGRRFDANGENVVDVIDDRIDVIGRGLLGLSVSCARCHDHKFDPIPTKDYYSLYGVFAGVAVDVRPVAGTPADRAKLAAFETASVRLRQKLEDFSLAEQLRLFGDAWAADGYATSLLDWQRSPDADLPPSKGRSVKLAERRRAYLNSYAKQAHHPILAPWFALAKLPPAEFAAKAPDVVRTLLADPKPLNGRVAALFRDRPAPRSLAEVAARYGDLFAGIDAEWRAALDGPRKEGTAFSKLPDPTADGVLRFLLGPDGWGLFPADGLKYLLNGAERDRYLQLLQELTDFKLSPAAPPHAMAVRDPATPHNPRVFVRGNPSNKGPEVPRQFLAIASPGGERTPFSNGTGRLDLARAVADPRNPLTARVWVNRVWAHLFGAGIVRTPSDFGLRGDPPTHPELLDHLASTFVADGWSTKRLIRRIVRSRSYGQASADRPDGLSKDPQNLLLWRANRRRLPFEAFRDAALAVAGALDPAAGGPAVDLSADPSNHRRTVYAKVDRVGLSALHRGFDFANPDLHTPQRFVTTVPQQGVLLLNHPFAADAARRLAGRADAAGPAEPAEWASRLYRLALGREPSARELAAAAGYLAESGPAKPPATRPTHWLYGSAKWDAGKQVLTGFDPLPLFQADAWQDPARAGKGQLTASGGRTAAGRDVALVRRWVAPAAGRVRVSGRFRPADGKPATAVVSGRRGVVGTWATGPDAVPTDVAEVNVAAGEALDFLVAPGPGGEAGFEWAVTVEPVGSPGMGRMVWNSAGHFDGPPPPPAAPLSPKEQLAQVLLLTNEFATLD